MATGTQTTLNTSSTPLFVGYNPLLPAVDWNRPWSGKIDSVRLYSRALTAEDIGFLATTENPSTDINFSQYQAMELRIPSRVGFTYQIQESPDLTTWFNAGSAFSGDDTLKRVYRTINQTRRFFRVVITENP